MESKTIYQKLFELQKEIKAILKDETNPYFKSKYFDINGLLKQLKPCLEKNSLLVLQPIATIDSKTVLKTAIVDIESNEKLEDYISLPQDNNPQEFGKVITYYRRYALQSLLALEAEDNDGNAITPPPKTENGQPWEKWSQDKSASVNPPAENSEACPQCGGKLVDKKGQYGPFKGCANYPNCKYIVKNAPNGRRAAAQRNSHTAFTLEEVPLDPNEPF